MRLIDAPHVRADKASRNHTFHFGLPVVWQNRVVPINYSGADFATNRLARGELTHSKTLTEISCRRHRRALSDVG